jgi:hypothetical protein
MMMVDYTPENLKKISGIIKRNLTYDLLPKKWFIRNASNPMFGHCHNAAGCLYKIFGHESMHMYRALDDEGIYHWWCIDKENVIIDLTSEQYTNFGRTPPYAEGQKANILGFEYRKRVMRLFNRVMNEYEDSDNYGSTLWRKE